MPYVHKDSQGVPIEVGQLVAYNMSGDVVPGEVVGFSPSSIKIWQLGSAYRADHVSKVRSGRSVLVIPPRKAAR